MRSVHNKLFLLLLVFSLFQTGLWAKEKKNSKQVQKFTVQEDEIDEDLLAKETEWQILEWEEKQPQYVYKYDITIERLNPKNDVYEFVNTLSTQGRETSIQVQPYLMPGIYRYKVITYDLFGFPSVESDWCDFTIYQAFYPEVRSASVDLNLSNTMYLDEYNDGIFTISGKNLFTLSEGPNDINFSEYYLIPNGKRNGLVPDILEHDDKNTKLKLSFKLSDLDSGIYNFVVRDASGLESKKTAANTITIKYKKAVDFDLSGGYSYVVLIYDSTLNDYLGTWLYPFSLNGKANLMFSKHTWGYLGLGLSGFYTFDINKTEKYTITGNTIRGYGNLVYQRPFFKAEKGDSRKRRHVATLELRAGGGVTYLNNFVFHFPHVNSDSYNKIFYGFDVGASGQWYISTRLFMEGSLDVVSAFTKENVLIEVVPSINIGWQF